MARGTSAQARAVPAPRSFESLLTCAETACAGVSYLVGNVTLTGAAYHINTCKLPTSRDAYPTMVVLRGMLSLSRRTTWYVLAAHARAAHGQPIWLSRDELGSTDTQTGSTTGIQYRF